MHAYDPHLQATNTFAETHAEVKNDIYAYI